MIKKLICYLKAIPFFLRTWEWVPHVYREEYEKATIISTDRSFRVSTGYEHSPGEKVYKNACLIRQRCKYCGHEKFGWYESWDERWKIQ